MCVVHVDEALQLLHLPLQAWHCRGWMVGGEAGAGGGGELPERVLLILHIRGPGFKTHQEDGFYWQEAPWRKLSPVPSMALVLPRYVLKE